MDISRRLLLLCLNHVCKPITALFKLCIKEEVVPEKFETAKITLVYKKGAANLMYSYRPISVLCNLNDIF